MWVQAAQDHIRVEPLKLLTLRRGERTPLYLELSSELDREFIYDNEIPCHQDLEEI